ncbi:PSP1 C-terminal conserved region-domain-containing protein [Lipomyces tetrasporus]|uniref:PSP1 C-terminal conserved region-domain-containing protein n=1 Tax=Lipomyces tetrasporus TaxID=54092 RepID=A0AAD7QR74_9ASCO|nr:PSP1 C-terminal conserved region-domain-containing protein [Lipomyces tetrasporus]KAJ8100024.1 PSP1 C-terminal conserved region-domain-containing protein [Lipomyces tetrasporus]
MMAQPVVRHSRSRPSSPAYESADAMLDYKAPAPSSSSPARSASSAHSQSHESPRSIAPGPIGSSRLHQRSSSSDPFSNSAAKSTSPARGQLSSSIFPASGHHEDSSSSENDDDFTFTIDQPLRGAGGVSAMSSRRPSYAAEFSSRPRGGLNVNLLAPTTSHPAVPTIDTDRWFNGLSLSNERSAVPQWSNIWHDNASLPQTARRTSQSPSSRGSIGDSPATGAHQQQGGLPVSISPYPNYNRAYRSLSFSQGDVGSHSRGLSGQVHPSVLREDIAEDNAVFDDEDDHLPSNFDGYKKQHQQARRYDPLGAATEAIKRLSVSSGLERPPSGTPGNSLWSDSNQMRRYSLDNSNYQQPSLPTYTNGNGIPHIGNASSGVRSGSALSNGSNSLPRPSNAGSSGVNANGVGYTNGSALPPPGTAINFKDYYKPGFTSGAIMHIDNAATGFGPLNPINGLNAINSLGIPKPSSQNLDPNEPPEEVDLSMDYPTACRLFAPYFDMPRYSANQRYHDIAAHGTANGSVMKTWNLPYPMTQRLYCVEFKAGRIDVFYIAEGSNLDVKPGDVVIVDADRGRDLGRVTHVNISVETAHEIKIQQHKEQQFALQQNGGEAPGQGESGPNPMTLQPKQIIRFAQPMEIQQLAKKKNDEDRALEICMQKVEERGMVMHVLDSEYQWDRRKLTFFYSAPRRIDFRELVRDLFRVYKTRIWMCAVVQQQ